jgi:hypothetical protein
MHLFLISDLANLRSSKAMRCVSASLHRRELVNGVLTAATEGSAKSLDPAVVQTGQASSRVRRRQPSHVRVGHCGCQAVVTPWW